MRKSILLLPAAAVLSGCSLIPALDPVASPVSSRFPGKTGGDLPADIAWQKFFADPRLKKIVATALENNRDLRIAALNVEQARAQYGISRSDLFPHLNANSSLNRHMSLGNESSGGSLAIRSETDDIRVGFTSYELDLFGRVRALNKADLQHYFASDAARLSAQISLVSQIATQYLTERAAQEQLALSTQTLDGMNVGYGIMKQRFDAGTVSGVELSSMDVQRQTAIADLAAFRQRIAELNNSLAFLAGAALPSGLPSGRRLDQVIVADVRAGVPSDLLVRRPDIREAEYELRAANANIGAARAAFFPTISLTANGGRASRSLDGLFSGGTSVWLFSPQIHVPIYAGGEGKAYVELTQVRKKIEIAQYERSIQSAFREVADSLAARRGLDERIAATEKLVAAQQKRTDLATARYNEGVDSYFEVLTATLDLYSARQSLIQLRLSRAIASVNLYKALGGGW